MGVKEGTMEQLIDRDRESGICVAINEDRNVVVFRSIGGMIEWAEELEPQEAEAIGRALVSKSREARRGRSH